MSRTNERNEALSTVAKAIEKDELRVRVKIADIEVPTSWSRWIISSTPSYAEIDQFGPFRIAELEWLEIECVGSKDLGRLLKPRHFDCTQRCLESVRASGIAAVAVNGNVLIRFDR
jgi:hypothetical protein